MKARDTTINDFFLESNLENKFSQFFRVEGNKLIHIYRRDTQDEETAPWILYYIPEGRYTTTETRWDFRMNDLATREVEYRINSFLFGASLVKAIPHNKYGWSDSTRVVRVRWRSEFANYPGVKPSAEHRLVTCDSKKRRCRIIPELFFWASLWGDNDTVRSWTTHNRNRCSYLLPYAAWRHAYTHLTNTEYPHPDFVGEADGEHCDDGVIMYHKPDKPIKLQQARSPLTRVGIRPVLFLSSKVMEVIGDPWNEASE